MTRYNYSGSGSPVDILLAVDGLQTPDRLGSLPAHVQQLGNCGENAPRDEEELVGGRHLEQEHQAAPPHRVPLQPIHTRALARVQGQGLQGRIHRQLLVGNCAGLRVRYCAP
jgi:hypothetical protein